MTTFSRLSADYNGRENETEAGRGLGNAESYRCSKVWLTLKGVQLYIVLNQVLMKVTFEPVGCS